MGGGTEMDEIWAGGGSVDVPMLSALGFGPPWGALYFEDPSGQGCIRREGTSEAA